MKFETRVIREAPIVRVEWIDSQQDGGGWVTFSSNVLVENIMISIGMMIEEDAEKIVVVPHVGLSSSGMPDQMAGRMVIPRVQISTITILQEARTS